MKPIDDAQLKQVCGGLLPSGPEGLVTPRATTTVVPDPSLAYQNAWAYAQQQAAGTPVYKPLVSSTSAGGGMQVR